MTIKPAQISDFETIKNITRQTITSIYPHYYPSGAVDFFLSHHSDETIQRDILNGYVFVCFSDEEIPVGTVTINSNEINRLFVLPEYQVKGFGGSLLNFAENRIFSQYSEIHLDASLPAKLIYLKRNYTITQSHALNTPNGDFLCYDVMTKLR